MTQRTLTDAGRLTSGEIARLCGCDRWQLLASIRRGFLHEPGRCGPFRLWSPDDVPRVRRRRRPPATIHRRYSMSRSANEPDARFHRMGTELYLPCGDHAKIEATRQRLLAELVNDPLASRVGSGPAVRRFGAVRAEAAAARDAADVASVTLSELDQQCAASSPPANRAGRPSRPRSTFGRRPCRRRPRRQSAALKGPLSEAADERCARSRT